MKESGRNIKRRLYPLSLIGERVARVKHFRGHGVHSPFVYNLVRKVFMRRTLIDESNTALAEALASEHLSERRVTELQNVMSYCEVASFSVNDLQATAEFNVLTTECEPTAFAEAAEAAKRNRTTLVILLPYASAIRQEACQEIVDSHDSTSVDNRAYLILFNNHLPKQHFKL